MERNKKKKKTLKAFKQNPPPHENYDETQSNKARSIISLWLELDRPTDEFLV